MKTAEGTFSDYKGTISSIPRTEKHFSHTIKATEKGRNTSWSFLIKVGKSLWRQVTSGSRQKQVDGRVKNTWGNVT